MKRLIFITLFTLPLCAFSQWNLIYVNEKPIIALDVVHPDIVYAVGNQCAIRTIDGGTTWTNINYNCDDIFFDDVNFPTSQIGYILGRSNIILKTEDYGNSWEQVSQDTTAHFFELDFISPDTGWIIGNYSNHGDIIMRTYDGGASWNYYYPDAFQVTHIQMINSHIGYITHWGGVLKTIDSGDSWSQLSDVYGDWIDYCSFINADTGFIVGHNLYKTENAGEDWTVIPNETIDRYGQSQLQFMNNDTGYYVAYSALADYGKLCTTTDGGYNWMEKEGEYDNIEMYNEDVGYCIEGIGNIYKTTVGGILVEINEYGLNIIPTLFPNPFDNQLFISVAELKTSNGQPVTFEIFEITGKKVYSKNIQPLTYMIHNLGNLQPGIYIYLIKSANSILISGKLLKKSKK